MSDAPDTNGGRRWLISITVMLTTIMVILDMTIVNVALPHMMGALGARSDQVTWVLTSFIVAEAIVIPLVGFLAGRFGRRRVLLVGIAGFTASSALCGLAPSLAQMVFFRVLQGLFGGPLIPLSQSVMVDNFPRSERGKAMAIWGMGIMLGPVLGPTLGGYITEYFGWRWVFYINLPVGLLNLALVAALISNATTGRRPVDLWGVLFMALGIGALQVVLDRGNQENWFASGMITTLALAGVAGLILFVVRSLKRSDGVLDLRLLRDRNLAVSCGMMLMFGLGLFGTIALQPIMLEQLLNYPAAMTGLVMAPRAVGSAFSMMVVSRLITRFEPRWLVGIGLLLAATGTGMMSGYSLDISPSWIVWPGLVQGLGMGMIFVPLSTLAYDTIPKRQTDTAAGLFNLARTIGSSIGISAAATALSRASQLSWNGLTGRINPFNPAVHGWLHAQGMTLGNPMAAQSLGGELARQSGMVAFIDVFWLIALSFIVLLPALLLIRPIHHKADPQPGASEGNVEAGGEIHMT